MKNRIIYLLGFASGPTSRKAHFFAERLRNCNRTLETPDLTAGDFERLTIDSQLNVLEQLLRSEPATLIGSSLGGYLAALYASRHPEINRLVLLAPAFGFTNHWKQTLSREALDRWRTDGTLSVYHYGEQRMRQLGYGIVEESECWPAEPASQHATHIFHGLQDTVVPAEMSRAYAVRNPHVNLTLVNSDHELTSALDEIWEGCRTELLI